MMASLGLKNTFWVIGCLNEFEVSIADNIKQWELY